MKNFQCHIFEGRLIVKTCFSKLTADCSSLEESCTVFRLNCKNAHERYAA